MVAVINPTALTPPRVAFIDERTGAISREWYRFFLSLVTATEANQQQSDTGPNVSSLLASYDSLLNDLAQEVQSAPDTASAVASLSDGVDNLAQAFGVSPQPPLGTMASVQQDNARFIGYSPAPSPPVVYTPGVTAWNVDDGTLDLGLYGGAVLKIGQQTLYYAKNTSGSSIPIGTPVMFTGVVGSSGKLTFGLAVADGSVPPEYMMGVTKQTIANNDFGYIVDFGLVRGFNTSGVPYGETWADGDLLYFDPAAPGTWTNVEPAAPNIHVPVAVVVNAATGGAGSIFVRMIQSERLGELQDVHINGVGAAAGQVLIYDATQQRWENNTLTAGTNIGIVNGDGTITISIDGVIGPANGGTGTSTAFTAGSVVFAGTSGVYAQDNANLFWDNTNDRLGIGTATPSNRLTVRNDTAPTFFDTTLDNTAFLICNRGAGSGNFGASLGFSRLDSTGRVNAAIAIKQTTADSDQCGLSFFTHSSASTGAALLEAVSITHAGNVGVNETAPDYKLDVNGTFGFTPGASVTPVDNGDVVFELTNNTTLTVKAKGSDGVVRSGTITLT
jgi:hypothetical protein